MLRYILDKKSAAGYLCSRCHGDQYVKAREWHYQRCKKCGYAASSTGGTLFHKCKLGLWKAIEISFRVSVRKKGISGCELAKEFGCQQRSAWLWKAKIQEGIKSSGKHELTGNKEVDEFMVGGFSPGEPGRTHGSKSLVVLGMEKVTDKKGKQVLAGLTAG